MIIIKIKKLKTLKKLRKAKKNSIFSILGVFFLILASCQSSDSKMRDLTKEQSSRLNKYIEPIESLKDFDKFNEDEFEIAICTNIHINNILGRNKSSVDYSPCKNLNLLNEYKKRFYITSFFERNLLDNKKTIVTVLDSNYGQCNLWSTLIESYKQYKFSDIAKLVESLNTDRNKNEINFILDSTYNFIKRKRALFISYRLKEFEVNKKFFLTSK